jgi:Lhr-like helicase
LGGGLKTGTRADQERILENKSVPFFVVSHSSLSVDERRRAEKAFSEARHCVIVATSTLELGIDAGDLDRVRMGKHGKYNDCE